MSDQDCKSAVTVCSIQPQSTRGMHRRGTPPLDTTAFSHRQREHHRWACHGQAGEVHCRLFLEKLSGCSSTRERSVSRRTHSRFILRQDIMWDNSRVLCRLGGLSSRKQLPTLCLGNSTWRMGVNLSKQSCPLQAKLEPRLLMRAMDAWKAAAAAAVGEAPPSIMRHSEMGTMKQISHRSIAIRASAYLRVPYLTLLIAISIKDVQAMHLKTFIACLCQIGMQKSVV